MVIILEGGSVGRIRTLQIKNIAEKLVEMYHDKFTNDFENNKNVVDELLKLNSKSTRNKIAGYITHIVERHSKDYVYETK